MEANVSNGRKIAELAWSPPGLIQSLPQERAVGLLCGFSPHGASHFPLTNTHTESHTAAFEKC